jgi:hypothetical protein
MVQTLKWKINTLIFGSFDMQVWSVWEFESQIGLNGLAQRIRSRPTSKALARWGDGFKKWRTWRDTWSNLKRPDRSGGCFSFRRIYCSFSFEKRVTNSQTELLWKIISLHAIERKEFEGENVCLCTVYFVMFFTFNAIYISSKCLLSLPFKFMFETLLFWGDSKPGFIPRFLINLKLWMFVEFQWTSKTLWKKQA